MPAREFTITTQSPEHGMQDFSTGEVFRVGDRVVDCGNAHLYHVSTWNSLGCSCPMPGCARTTFGERPLKSSETLLKADEPPLENKGNGRYRGRYNGAILLVIPMVVIIAFACIAVSALLILPSLLNPPPAPTVVVERTVVVTTVGEPDTLVVTATQSSSNEREIPTPHPSASPRPTSDSGNSEPAPLSATSTPSCPAVSGPFVVVWSDIPEQIGCASGHSISGLIAEENFEDGKMFWREPIDYAQAVVLFADGTWRIFEHSPYPESGPEYWCTDENTPAQTPPTPRRGFGMMWCDIPEIRSRLGNATDDERGYVSNMQSFQRGFMIQTDYGDFYVFYDSGYWEIR